MPVACNAVAISPVLHLRGVHPIITIPCNACFLRYCDALPCHASVQFNPLRSCSRTVCHASAKSPVLHQRGTRAYAYAHPTPVLCISAFALRIGTRGQSQACSANQIFIRKNSQWFSVISLMRLMMLVVCGNPLAHSYERTTESPTPSITNDYPTRPIIIIAPGTNRFRGFFPAQTSIR